MYKKPVCKIYSILLSLIRFIIGSYLLNTITYENCFHKSHFYSSYCISNRISACIKIHRCTFRCSVSFLKSSCPSFSLAIVFPLLVESMSFSFSRVTFSLLCTSCSLRSLFFFAYKARLSFFLAL